MATKSKSSTLEPNQTSMQPGAATTAGHANQEALPRLLVDTAGRRIRKLRVSLLDACNFRCFYCLPEKAQFHQGRHWLTRERLTAIASHLVANGVEQIRVTGGEPTIHSDFLGIMADLSRLPLASLGVTSNGFLLGSMLAELAKTRCRSLNISLDSLNEDRFHKITRRRTFRKTLANILKARHTYGFEVKINMIMMRGINTDEILDFVAFAEQEAIEVRFLELMRIGSACGSQQELFMSAAEATKIIALDRTLKPLASDHDATAFRYVTAGGGVIGFIASESQPFCGTCSRWRLSANGILRACLMSEDGIDLKAIPQEQYAAAYAQLLTMKPTDRIYEISQNMNQIGG